MVVGMTQIRRRQVVIRQLSALEALGGVTNICSDKTGTLTQGKMIVRKVWLPGSGTYSLEGSERASDPKSGSVTYENESVSRSRDPAEVDMQAPFQDAGEAEKSMTPIHAPAAVVTPHLEHFLTSISLCNLARMHFDDQNKEWNIVGDPTESALQIFAHRFEFDNKKLEDEHDWKLIAEYPFDSLLKTMTVLCRNSDASRVMTKGAAEYVMERCTKIRNGDRSEEIFTKLKQNAVLRQMTFLADQGLRVLAVAQKTLNHDDNLDGPPPRDYFESDLTLLGLAGLYDPPRLETKSAVSSCSAAGIRVHMLTGDQASTASAIAREVGILSGSSPSYPSVVMTAREFDRLTDVEINDLPALPLVLARCAPDTKTRMVHALHRRRHFVAMTGDGVNDAPSLQAADVGIAMGLAGSDVAKSAASMVLTDDNFAGIVNAIEEGRRMFDNIQKFILHLLTGNVGEVILLIGGLGFQDDSGSSVFPLSPLAILWINMLTSSFPAFGLGREKADSNEMRRPPQDGRKGVFTAQIIIDLVVYGTMMGTLSLLSFVLVVYGTGPKELGNDCNRSYSPNCSVVFRARATVFVEVTWLILISAWEFTRLRQSMFAARADEGHVASSIALKSIYQNWVLFYSVLIGAVSVLPAVYIPGLNRTVFKHAPISWEWGLAVGVVVVFVSWVEGWKACKRSYHWFNTSGASDILGLENQKV